MADPDFLTYELLLQITVATLCGAVVGAERQLRGKPAGLRTSIIVCLGAATYVGLGQTADVAGASYDPARVLGQIVVGVGFLGAGTIMNRGDTVSGLTSAAVLWVLAAIGAAVGLGRYSHAVALTSWVVVTLVGIEFAERRLKQLRRGVHAWEQIVNGTDEVEPGSLGGDERGNARSGAGAPPSPAPRRPA